MNVLFLYQFVSICLVTCYSGLGISRLILEVNCQTCDYVGVVDMR